MTPEHIINIQVGFVRKEQADAFWTHLHGANDVLGKMEEGVYIATGERPYVDIAPEDEDRLIWIAHDEGAWS